METLVNHKLLIDADCPMCKAYTGMFVRFDLLNKNGVLDYTTVSDHRRSESRDFCMAYF